MSTRDLACANCSGPVSEGRCPVCRAARRELQHGLPLWLVLTLIMLAAVASLFVTLRPA